MASLGEVYGGEGRRETGVRRLYAGGALFLAGVCLVVAGIVVATTGVVRGDGVGLLEAREYGGVLAGVGVPAVFLGILTVLPADRSTRIAAGVGAAIALLGVGLFTHAYPCRWSGASCAPGLPDLTLPTAGVYFLGTLVTFWYLFVGVANFKRRNDPGGTVRMEVTRRGETQVVEVDPRRTGTVGLGTGAPDGGTPTRSGAEGGTGSGIGAEAEAEAEAEAGAGAGATGERGGAASDDGAVLVDEPATSDGGATTDEITGFDDGRIDRENVPGDPYCGNCEQFEYVRTERGMQPYCGAHDEQMDDMEPCDEWRPRGD